MIYVFYNGLEWYECYATVKNNLGIHGRPAMEVSNVAQTYSGRIMFIHKEEEADAKSLIEILGQCLLKDASITLRVEKGNRCEALASQLVALLERIDL